MIGYLKGEVKNLFKDYLLLEVGGVGYKIETNVPFRLGVEGQSAEVYTYTHVREQELRLFGFATQTELEMFESLLAVSGVGPKSAMQIVAEHSLARITEAVELAQPEKLKVKGIGSKTLSKIVLELKGRLPKQSGQEASANGQSTTEDAELISALENLGYKREEIEDSLEKVEVGHDEPFASKLKKLLNLIKS
ncbi:MAG: Holliday junction branch migration protein RuvA [Candidatus Dojkabacteria bacterium]